MEKKIHLLSETQSRIQRFSVSYFLLVLKTVPWNNPPTNLSRVNISHPSLLLWSLWSRVTKPTTWVVCHGLRAAWRSSLLSALVDSKKKKDSDAKTRWAGKNENDFVTMLHCLARPQVAVTVWSGWHMSSILKMLNVDLIFFFSQITNFLQSSEKNTPQLHLEFLVYNGHVSID